MKIDSLTLLGSRKNYSVRFKSGFNLISGPTSTGKTSILEMIDYVLGAKKHKDYIEIRSSCSSAQLVLWLGDHKYRITRELFNFHTPVIVEEWDEEKKKFLFYNRYEIDIPSNPKSLSAFLLEKLGMADITIKGQNLSFRDLYKYCYLKQTEIDNENIMRESDWVHNIKRKATFEIIFNVYDELLEEYKRTLENRKKEIEELSIRLSGIEEFLKNVEIGTLIECNNVQNKLRKELKETEEKLDKLKKSKGNMTPEAIGLREEIENCRNTINHLKSRKNDQTQYINKLKLLYNQYSSEIEKKELAIQGYLTFNKYEFVLCPNCLQPLTQKADATTCCLCGSEKTNDAGEVLIEKKEIQLLKRKRSELEKFITLQDKDVDGLLHDISDLNAHFSEMEMELAHLSKGYLDPVLEKIEYFNYELGRKNRELAELEKDEKMFEELDRLRSIFKEKEKVISSLKDTIKKLSENAVNKEELIQTLSETFEQILKDFQYPDLTNAFIDDKNYLPYVRGRKYSELGSLGGVTLITIAYYVSILLVGASNLYHHPNLLIIDSPRKNLGAQTTKEVESEFRDERIFNAIMQCLMKTAEDNKDNIQVIVVNNGCPEFIPKECVVAEFDSDQKDNLPKGLIDDAVNQ